jgi:hypothetical protein
MDIHCRICGEPWDNDTFHEAADEQEKTYRDVMRDFQRRGCIAIGWQSQPCQVDPDAPRDRTFGLTAAEASGVLAEMLGDDTDGAMAMLEDLRF